MNLSPTWVDYLEQHGIEAQHWSKIGQPNAPDTMLFNWAATHQAIVFTNDLDFGAILAISQASKPSVFQLKTRDLLPQTVGEVVIQTLKRFERDLQMGALVTVDLERARVRILPLV